jgi:2-phosphosulfolactate phosphatase
MRADIQLIPRNVPAKEAEGRVFVVIDALRATTTIVEALSNGCTEVIPVVTVEEAFHLVKKSRREDTLIGGERGGLRVDGFDFIGWRRASTSSWALSPTSMPLSNGVWPWRPIR